MSVNLTVVRGKVMNSHSQLLQAIQYKGGISCIYGTCYDETNWSQLVANYILFNLIKYSYNKVNSSGGRNSSNGRSVVKRYPLNNSKDINGLAGLLHNNNDYNNEEEEEQVILLLNFDSHHLTGQYLDQLMKQINNSRSNNNNNDDNDINSGRVRSSSSSSRGGNSKRNDSDTNINHDSNHHYPSIEVCNYNSNNNMMMKKKMVTSYHHHRGSQVYILDYTNHAITSSCSHETAHSMMDDNISTTTTSTTTDSSTPRLDYTSILYDVKTLLQKNYVSSKQIPSMATTETLTISSSSSSIPTIFIYSLSELIIYYGLLQTKGSTYMSITHILSVYKCL